MKSRTWFLLSMMLFIAAALFWRLGNERHAAQQTAREQSNVAARMSASKAAAPSGAMSAPGKLLTEPRVDASSTNAPALYPNRLRNTSKTDDQLARDDKAILLLNAAIDTGAGGVNIPAQLRSKGDPGSYIVQSRGPLTDLFRAELQAANAQIISYVPNNAYLVRVSAGGAEKLAANKDVQSILAYEPYYKLDSGLLDMVMKNEVLALDQFVRVTLFPGQRDAAIRALKGKGTVLDEDLKSSPFGPELVVSTGDLVALANMTEVQAVEPYYERVLLNDLTRVRVGVSTNTTSPANHLNLTGQNVLVNVNDTTIDNGHPDLSPRIFPGVGVGTTDLSGHGTLVAGIIASSGTNGPMSTNIPGSVAGASFRGKAPAANIFSLDIFAGLPDWQLQETAARTNLFVFKSKSPLISNNAWGYGTRAYNSAAASYDMAVRDSIPGVTGSQPIAFVFSAGDGGSGNNNGQGGAPGSIVSPATAKNVITVGALESPRNITNDIIRRNRSCVIQTNQEFIGYTDSSNQVAYLSSRGNVGISLEGTFGRFKPDLVAPGTFIASTRSRQLDEGAYYSTTNIDARTFPGLVIQPGDTNNFSIFIPTNFCDAGHALSFSIATVPNGASPNPFPGLEIYVNNAPVPSATPANFLGTNFVFVQEGDPKFFPGATVYYDIVNTNAIEVAYDLRTVVVSTNDFGNYFTELKALNDALGTNYFYETGSSMAAPAVSGMLALMQEFFEQTLPAALRRTNSPAMMKAMLINSARTPNDLIYKLEADRSLNIPGWGLPNLTRILPAVLASEADTNRWPIQMFDQEPTNSLATGESYTRTVTVTDVNAPLRITLVWTDPPGNPQVGVKLVNNLDLVVTTVTTNVVGTNTIITTNAYFGNNFPGGSQFTEAVDIGTNMLSDFDLARDVVNNVENVYINGPLNATYEVSVVARRVNVNAVTAHTNGVVQDYALVISSGNLTTNAPFTVAPATNALVANTKAIVTNITTVITNGISLLNQRVGANAPLRNINSTGLTDGVTNQWNFYAINAGNLSNVAFFTFLTPNISGTTNVSPNSRRTKEADIDMYVSTDPTLTNLNPAAIAGADRSRGRGGQELILYTNANAATFYVGIKSEDQQAAEYNFFGIASLLPFDEEDENGNLTLRGLVAPGQSDIPDGSPQKPGGAFFIAFATRPITVARVVVTNTFTHERIGDLLGTLSHGEAFAVLNNHSFPDGQENGTFTGIYDDSELTGSDGILGSRPGDGPGQLIDFIGEEGIGAWLLTMEDNALNATGRVDFLSIFVERSLETNDLFGGNGFTISSFELAPGTSAGLNFVVPAGATNMIISIAPKEGPIDTVVRRGRAIAIRAAPGGPYVDKGAIIAPPGGVLTVDTNDVPPLSPGRYSLRLYNDNAFKVTISGFVEFQLDLSLRSLQTFISSGPSPIFDDAVMTSIINVDRPGSVVSTEVSVRIDHQRVSDLTLHLISPEGRRILLAENRGGFATNGYGISSLTTNVSPPTSSGDANADTNIVMTSLNAGILNIDYDFFTVPDRLRVYYDGLRIFDSGQINGSGRFTVPFGPGIQTNVVIVMNEGGNPEPMTMWNYTATVLSGNIVYATFSENTNLALMPIKFAIPPFATNLPGSNVTTFLSSGFETVAPGNYNTAVEGWTVTTNSVNVIGNSTAAHSGSNYVDLGGTLPAAIGAGILAGPITNSANGHYYYLLAANSWTNSEARAASLGGHLVTINDAAEDNWVYTTFSNFGGTPRGMWIGLTDRAQEGSFVWTSGQTSAYRNWAAGEPSDSLGNEDFAHIVPPTDSRAGRWNDLDDTSTFFGPLNGVVEVDPGIGGISRVLPTIAGDLYSLKFAYRRSQPAGASSARVSLEGVFTNDFTGDPGWIVNSTTFAAAKTGINLDILGLQPGMLFDSFVLTSGGDPNFFVPEESLATLAGENARGNWQLEVWDNRVGAPLGELVSWQLHLTFASTTAFASALSNSVPATNTVSGGEIKYFIIDVPLFATRATNILVSGGGPLNLLYNPSVLPVGNQASGDVTLLTSTVNGTNVLTTTTFPVLNPGQRYYLGVKNVSAAQTNFFTLTVAFDNTNNLVSVTPLANAVPLSTNLPLSSSIQYYQYDLFNSVSTVEFRLYNLSADADLVVRRDRLPTQTVYDRNSTAGGTNDEVITVTSPPLGRYYLGVYGFLPTGAITYTVLVTEGTAALAPTILSAPTLTESGFSVTANTTIGAQYEFAFTKDFIEWTVVSTITATSNITTFTDATAPATQVVRFYRLRRL